MCASKCQVFRPVKFFHTDWIIISLWSLSYTQRHCRVKQDKAKVKKRWTEYCSGLYTDTGNSDTIITELDQISPLPNEDEIHYILYKEVAEAVKRLKKGKSPGIDEIIRKKWYKLEEKKLQTRYTQSVIRYGRKGEYQRNGQSQSSSQYQRKETWQNVATTGQLLR